MCCICNININYTTKQFNRMMLRFEIALIFTMFEIIDYLLIV